MCVGGDEGRTWVNSEKEGMCVFEEKDVVVLEEKTKL